MKKILLIVLSTLCLGVMAGNLEDKISLNVHEEKNYLEVVFEKITEGAKGNEEVFEIEVFYEDSFSGLRTRDIQHYSKNKRDSIPKAFTIEKYTKKGDLYKLTLSNEQSSHFFDDKDLLVVKVHNYPNTGDVVSKTFSYQHTDNTKKTGELRGNQDTQSVVINGNYPASYYGQGRADINYYYRDEDGSFQNQYIKSVELDEFGDFRVKVGLKSLGSLSGQFKVIIKNGLGEEISQASFLDFDGNKTKKDDPILDPDHDTEEIKQNAQRDAAVYVNYIFDQFSEVESKRRSAYLGYKHGLNSDYNPSRTDGRIVRDRAMRKAKTLVARVIEKQEYADSARAKAKSVVYDNFKYAARTGTKPSKSIDKSKVKVKIPSAFEHFTYTSSLYEVENVTVVRDYDYQRFFGVKELKLSSLENSNYTPNLLEMGSNLVFEQWLDREVSSFYSKLSSVEKDLFKKEFVYKASSRLDIERRNYKNDRSRDYYTYEKSKKLAQASLKNKVLSRYGQEIGKDYIRTEGISEYKYLYRNEYFKRYEGRFNELMNQSLFEAYAEKIQITGKAMPGNSLNLEILKGAFLSFGGKNFKGEIFFETTNPEVILSERSQSLDIDALASSPRNKQVIEGFAQLSDNLKVEDSFNLSVRVLNQKGILVFQKEVEVTLKFENYISAFISKDISSQDLREFLDQEYSEAIAQNNKIYSYEASRVSGGGLGYKPKTFFGKFARYYIFIADSYQKRILSEFVRNNLSAKKVSWWDFSRKGYIKSGYNKLLKLIK